MWQSVVGSGNGFVSNWQSWQLRNALECLLTLRFRDFGKQHCGVVGINEIRWTDEWSGASLLTCPPNRPVSGVLVKFPLSGHKYSSKKLSDSPFNLIQFCDGSLQSRKWTFQSNMQEALVFPSPIHPPSPTQPLPLQMSASKNYFLPVSFSPFDDDDGKDVDGRDKIRVPFSEFPQK